MRRVVATLFVSIALAAGIAPAGADVWTWPDKGGGGGPLGIAGVRTEHGSLGPLLVVKFDGRLNPKAMGRKDFIVVDVEMDGRGKSEEWIYFVAVRGQLRTFTYYPKSKSTVIDNIGFSFGPRSIMLPTLDSWEHEQYGGHAFAVGAYSESSPGCSRGCWDVAPNRGYLVHDYTAPEITAFSAPREYWYEPEVPVGWRVKDRGLSRIREIFLRTSEAGTGKWSRAATRRAVGRHEVSLPAVEGSHMMFQVVAQDRARNTTASDFRLTRIPFDQASDTGPGTFQGLWVEEPDDTAHGGTVHTSTLPMDSFSFSDDANEFCVIARWAGDPGAATLEAGEESVEVAPSTALEPTCVQTDRIEEQTATVTVQSGRLSVDAYWSGADGTWARNGTLRPREAAGGHDHSAGVTRGRDALLREMKSVSRSTRPQLSR
jgi:hypothetical protein